MILLAGLASCGPSAKEREAEQARLAYDSISIAVDAGRYDEALALVDSFNVRYPLQIELRKKTNLLKTRSIEQLTLRQIEEADSSITNLRYEVAKLDNDFVLVQPNPNVKGYYVPKAIKGRAMSGTGIEPRLGDNDMPWTLLVNIAGMRCDVSSIEFKNAAGTTVASVSATSSDRSVKDDSGSTTFFTPEESAPLGQYCAQNPGALTGYASGHGIKNPVKISVNAQLADAIGRTWQIANAKEALQTALITREKLERRLQIARDQIANALPDSIQQTTQTK
jgi:hypothetical protein